MQRAELGERDVDLFTAAIAALAEIRERSALRREAVRLLPQLVSTTLIAWNEVDRLAGSMVAVMAPDRHQDASDADFIASIDEHPVIAYYERTRDGRPLAISDFLSADAFHATRIYQRFYRLIGAEDQISFVVPEPSLLIGVALNRDQRGFSGRDRTMLNLVRPVLALAYRNASAAERLDRLLAGIGGAAERGGEGVVLLDDHEQPEFIGQRSRELMRQWFDEPGDAALPQPLTDWLQATRRRPGPPWPLVIERSGRQLVVRLLYADTGKVLLLSEPDRLDRVAVTAQLGLTAREAQIMDLVSQAVSTGAIAQRLGISQATVYKHVQNSLDKLGVSSRIEAVNLLRQAERPLSGDAVGRSARG